MSKVLSPRLWKGAPCPMLSYSQASSDGLLHIHDSGKRPSVCWNQSSSSNSWTRRQPVRSLPPFRLLFSGFKEKHMSQLNKAIIASWETKLPQPSCTSFWLFLLSVNASSWISLQVTPKLTSSSNPWSCLKVVLFHRKWLLADFEDVMCQETAIAPSVESTCWLMKSKSHNARGQWAMIKKL